MKKRKQRRSTSISTITTSQESQVSIRNRFHPFSRVSSGGKTKNGLGHQPETKLSNAAIKNRACKSTSCIGITPSECSCSSFGGFMYFFIVYLGALWLCSFDKEPSLGVMPMHNIVCKLCSPLLHCLIWFLGDAPGCFLSFCLMRPLR